VSSSTGIYETETETLYTNDRGAVDIFLSRNYRGEIIKRGEKVSRGGKTEEGLMRYEAGGTRQIGTKEDRGKHEKTKHTLGMKGNEKGGKDKILGMTHNNKSPQSDVETGMQRGVARC